MVHCDIKDTVAATQTIYGELYMGACVSTISAPCVAVRRGASAASKQRRWIQSQRTTPSTVTKGMYAATNKNGSPPRAESTPLKLSRQSDALPMHVEHTKTRQQPE